MLLYVPHAAIRARSTARLVSPRCPVLDTHTHTHTHTRTHVRTYVLNVRPEPTTRGRQCYGVTNGHWAPVTQANITSGRVLWPSGSSAALACKGAPPAPSPPAGPCSTALDCGLNGVCDTNSGSCKCRPAWTGKRCQTLALLPASLSAGYREKSPSGSGSG